jgi:S-adenosylmethionine decarboxylase
LNAIGLHLLIELEDCNSAILDDVELIEKYMVQAAERAKATILKTYFHKFSPVGVTGVVALAESHISIHTWPEYNYAAVDIFTCGIVLQPQTASQYLIDKLECKTPVITEIKRGKVKLPIKDLISV